MNRCVVRFSRSLPRPLWLPGVMLLWMGSLGGCFHPSPSPLSIPGSKPLTAFLDSRHLRAMSLAETFERRGTFAYVLTNSSTLLKVEVHPALDAESAEI